MAEVKYQSEQWLVDALNFIGESFHKLTPVAQDVVIRVLTAMAEAWAKRVVEKNT